MTEQMTGPDQQRSRVRPPESAARTVADDVKVANLAAVAAALVWALWTQVAGVELEVSSSGGGTRTVGLVAVIISTNVFVLAGGALLRWLRGRSPAGTRRWTQVAVGFAALSLLGPASATTSAAGLGLASMHVVVATIAILVLRRVHGGR